MAVLTVFDLQKTVQPSGLSGGKVRRELVKDHLMVGIEQPGFFFAE